MTKAELYDEAARLRRAGLPLREIAERLGKSHTRIAAILRDMKTTLPPDLRGKRRRNLLRVSSIRCATGRGGLTSLVEVDALCRGRDLTCCVVYARHKNTTANLWEGDRIIASSAYPEQVDALEVFKDLISKLPKDTL